MAPDLLLDRSQAHCCGGGAAPDRTLFDITDEDWRKGIDTNLTGAFY